MTRLVILQRFLVWVGVSHRLVLLPGHVRSEDRLHDEGGGLLLPVAFPLHTHPLVLLDGDGGLRATHELCQAEKRQEGVCIRGR